jgi:hypothetical protein
MGVAEIMETNAGETRFRDELLEGIREDLGMDGGAVVVSKDAPVAVRAVSSRRAKQLDRARVEIDRAPGGPRLAPRVVQLVGDRDERPVDREPLGLEVDVSCYRRDCMRMTVGRSAAFSGDVFSFGI